MIAARRVSAELVAAQSDNDVLGNLATIAYTYTFTLRQALATLQGKGTVERRSGRTGGTFIREPRIGRQFRPADRG